MTRLKTWEPVTTFEQIVNRFENSTLDYKTTYDLSSKATPYEIAKDVVAFANAFGGTIIVGVVESKGRPIRLEGVADVSKLTREVATSLQQHCEPCPATPEEQAFVVSPLDAGRLLATGCVLPTGEVTLVALNVHPDSRGPLGVKPFDPGTQALADTYRFPVRVDDHTRFLPPTELPMWMNSHDRRVAIQLRALQPATIVRAFQHVHSAYDFDQRTVNFVDIDEGEMIARFSMPGEHTLAHVPLAFISAVWLEPHDEVWSIKIEGTVFPTSSPKYNFRPARG